MPNNGIPAPRVAVLEKPDSLMSRSWYRFMYNLFARFVEETGILKTTFGGTGLGTYATGDMLYASATDTLAAIGKPTESSYLGMSAAGVPSWNSLDYGAFESHSDQSAAAANTPYETNFSATTLSHGITLQKNADRINTQIACSKTAVYNFQFSVQFDKSGGTGPGLVWVWARINGEDVPYSASQVRLQNTSSELVAAWNFLLSMNAGDYFELMWATDDTTCIMSYIAASGDIPAIPSVILTVTQVNV